MNKIKQLLYSKGNREPVKSNQLQLLAIKAFIGFFVLIILLTILSRTTQAFTVPKVKVTQVSDSNLVYNISGEGKVETQEVRYVELPAGIRVACVYVSVGSYTEQGQPMLGLDMEDINYQLEQEERKLDRLKLQIEQEKLSADNTDLILLKLEELQMDYDDINSGITRLNALKDSVGVIQAPCKGRINRIDAVIGERTGVGEEIVIGTAGFMLHGSLYEELGKYLDVGDELIVSRIGKNDKFSASITNLSNTNDNRIELFAQLPEDEQYTSASLTFSIQKLSSKYRNCIPLSAIRQDQKGTFLYVLKETDSLLGKEYHAERIEVQILERDQSKAVIKEGQVTYDDSIIINSNKIIEEGDKVRLED